MQQRIEVDGPADTEGLGHQDLRRIFIPESITYALKGGEAKVIGDAENMALPCPVLRWEAQLIPDGCGDKDREHYTSDYPSCARFLFAFHSFFLLSKANKLSFFDTDIFVWYVLYISYERLRIPGHCEM